MACGVTRALIGAALLLTGACDGPGFGERDQYVVHTPLYADNRVLYLDGQSEGSAEGVYALRRPGARETITAEKMTHGQPLSLVLTTVSLPKEESVGSRDIAIIVDLASASDGGGRSIVAWYQRGVKADQNLNFSYLLLFHEAAWDDRIAPLVRIRVMDVTVERNLETRAALAEVSKFQGLVGAAIPNPIINPIFELATKAASLVLANRPNKMLLDYTAQFYSAPQLAAAYGSDLPPLRKGRFVLIGRKDGDRNYWKQEFKYDSVEQNVYVSSAAASSRPLPSPFVMISISSIDAVVPTSVAARSAFLQKMLSDAQQTNFDRMQEEATLLKGGVDALVAYEQLRRYRTIEALDNVITVMNRSTTDLSVSDQAFLMRQVSQLSKCSFASASAIKSWWDAGAKSRVTFKPDEFALTGVSCPK